VIACLAGYWIMMRCIAVPGFGVPGRDIPLLDPDANLVAWLDRKLLFGHLYEVTRDPEGLLSTIPAVASCLIGLLTGEWLRSERGRGMKAVVMAGVGISLVIAGELSNVWFPINKKLWTSSYVLFTSGLALACLAACYGAFDIKRWRGRWVRPFLIFGKNAIAAYVFSELVAAGLDSLHVRVPDDGVLTWHEVIYGQLFAPLADPANASLIYALDYVLLCWAVMWVLDRKEVFLKV
jgi:predicted acyltransferase